MKSEPDVFSISHLEERGRSGWDGVRNYQARNYMRDEMKVGDRVLFYHSSTAQPGIAGLAEVSAVGLVDPTQFDSESDYFDAKATPAQPRWWMVEIAFVEKFSTPLSLSYLRSDPDFEGLLLLRPGQRLSIQPVSQEHYGRIVELARRFSSVGSQIAVESGRGVTTC
jgi:predicted RNA-binding protein with PUA-like domain